jgi:hypothetical protein
VVAFEVGHGMAMRGHLVDPSFSEDPVVWGQWMEQIEASRTCRTILLDGLPMIVVGIVMRWEGVGDALMMTHKDAAGHAGLVKALRRVYWDLWRKCQCRRVQVLVRMDCLAGIRLAAWMGFKWEACLSGFFTDQVDGVLMAMVGQRGAS